MPSLLGSAIAAARACGSRGLHTSVIDVTRGTGTFVAVYRWVNGWSARWLLLLAVEETASLQRRPYHTETRCRLTSK